jgi:hypothetical protein
MSCSRVVRMFVTLFLSLLAVATSTMKDCSIGSHIGHIRTMTMDPAAPVAGGWAQITIDYDLDSDVTAGDALYEGSFNGFPFVPTMNPLCPDFANTTSPCPLLLGPVYYQNWVQMGDGTIHGTLVASTTWSDQNGAQILCWSFTVRF